MKSYVLNGINGLAPSGGGTLTFSKGGGGNTYFPQLRGGPFDGDSGPTDTGDQLPNPDQGGDESGGSTFADIIATIVNFAGDVLDWLGIEVGGGAWSGYPVIVHEWYTAYGPSEFLAWMRTHHDDKLHVPSVELQMAYLYEWLKGTGRTPAYPFHSFSERYNPGYYKFPFTEQTYSALGIDYWPSLFTYGHIGFPGNGYHAIAPPFPGGWTSEAVAYANATGGAPVPPPPPGNHPPTGGTDLSTHVAVKPGAPQEKPGGGGSDPFGPGDGGTPSGGTSVPIIPLALLYALFSR